MSDIRNADPVVSLPSPAGPTSRGLSARQEHFCQLYVSGRTATDAYREAYENVKTARVAGSRLLTSVNVQLRVKTLQEQAACAAVLTLQQKRAYLYRAVLTPIGEVNGESDLCQKYEEFPCEGGIRVKVSMPDKLRAIELDAKLAGELTDKQQHQADRDDGMIELLAKISRSQIGVSHRPKETDREFEGWAP